MKTNLFMAFREWRLYSDGSVLITPEWPRRRYLTFTDHGFGLMFDRGQDQVHSMVSHAIYLGQMFFSSSLLCSYQTDLPQSKWKNSSPHTQLQIEESVQTTCRTHRLLNLVTVLCYMLHLSNWDVTSFRNNCLFLFSPTRAVQLIYHACIL